jgi:tetratricopeptide (TPR) repeat protein
MSEWKDNLSRAEELCEEGQRLLEEGHLHQAGRCFEMAVELAPDHAEANFHLGSFYLEADRPTEAVAALRRALAAEPANAEALLMLGDAYLSQGRPVMALASFRQAAALTPHDAEILCALGRAAHEAGMTAEALEALEQALAIDPDNAEALIGIARIHYEADRLDDSLAYLDAAIHASPELAAPHLYKGMTLQDLGRLEAAEAEYRHAAELDVDNPMPAYNLAHLCWRQGRLEEALRHFEQALAIAPDYVHAGRDYADLLRDLGRAADAARVLRGLRDQHPADPELAHALALLLIDNGDPAAAAEPLAALRRLAEHNPMATALAAEVCEAIGEDTEAADWARRSLAAGAPNRGLAHAVLGRVAESAGTPAEAAREFRRALRLAEDKTGVAMELADHYARHGRPGAAVGVLRYADKHMGEEATSEPLRRAADLLVGMGAYDKALAMTTEALRRFPHDTGLLVWRARALDRLGRVGDALRVLRAALSDGSATVPGDPYLRTLFFLAGELEFDHGHRELAPGLLRRALAEGLEHPEALWRTAVMALACSDGDTAAEALERGVGLHPGTWRFPALLGALLLASPRTPAPELAPLEALLDGDSANGGLWLLVGVLRRRAGRGVEGRRAILRGLALLWRARPEGWMGGLWRALLLRWRRG